MYSWRWPRSLSFSQGSRQPKDPWGRMGLRPGLVARDRSLATPRMAAPWPPLVGRWARGAAGPGPRCWEPPDVVCWGWAGGGARIETLHRWSESGMHVCALATPAPQRLASAMRSAPLPSPPACGQEGAVWRPRRACSSDGAHGGAAAGAGALPGAGPVRRASRRSTWHRSAWRPTPRGRANGNSSVGAVGLALAVDGMTMADLRGVAGWRCTPRRRRWSPPIARQRSPARSGRCASWRRNWRSARRRPTRA